MDEVFDPDGPVHIFSCRKDPIAVLNLLEAESHKLGVEFSVNQAGGVWRKIELKRTSKKWRLTFLNDPDYYDAPDWHDNVSGMAVFFSEFPDGPHKRPLLPVIETFRFALAVEWKPTLAEEGDERFRLICDVARLLDGVFFSTASLFDASGRVLMDPTGCYDPQARVPSLTYEGDPSVAPSSSHGTILSSESEEEDAPAPPSLERVKARTLALLAVANRGFLEHSLAESDLADAKKLKNAFYSWAQSLELQSELEPLELEILQTEPGKLEQQETINAVWRFEGVAILAWALGLCMLPPYDQLVSTDDLNYIFGFLKPAETVQSLEKSRPKTLRELEAMKLCILGLHWRLREFTLRRRPIEFQQGFKNAWRRDLDISNYQTIDGDLCICGKRIDNASPSEFDMVLSATMERHLAINWLCGQTPLYSKTHTST